MPRIVDLSVTYFSVPHDGAHPHFDLFPDWYGDWWRGPEDSVYMARQFRDDPVLSKHICTTPTGNHGFKDFSSFLVGLSGRESPGLITEAGCPAPIGRFHDLVWGSDIPDLRWNVYVWSKSMVAPVALVDAASKS